MQYSQTMHETRKNSLAMRGIKAPYSLLKKKLKVNIKQYHSKITKKMVDTRNSVLLLD